MATPTITIRPASASDESAFWEILRPVIASGDTFVFDPQAPREDVLAFWFGPGTHTYVAEQDAQLLGGYALKPNQPGLGAHVANSGFVVSPAVRGMGLGRAMGKHCLSEARRLGFRAMQFNYVVSTNEVALRLWKDLGFEIVGTLPAAFRHAQHGFVDVYVMFRKLDDVS